MRLENDTITKNFEKSKTSLEKQLNDKDKEIEKIKQLLR